MLKTHLTGKTRYELHFKEMPLNEDERLFVNGIADKKQITIKQLMTLIDINNKYYRREFGESE